MSTKLNCDIKCKIYLKFSIKLIKELLKTSDFHSTLFCASKMMILLMNNE